MRRAKHERVKRPKKTPKNGNTLDLAALIDKLFAEEMTVKEGNRIRRVTCVRAIMHQLWRKSFDGGAKAYKLFMRHARFFAAQVRESDVELRFGPDMLTAEQVERKRGLRS